MAAQIVPDSQTQEQCNDTPQEEFIRIAGDLCLSMNCFFDLAEREIAEIHSTDVDNLEFLLKSARTEINSFDEEISGLDDDVADAGKHEPIMNTQKAKVHSPHDDLTGELIFLNDYLELIRDRANEGSDGKLVALVAAAMPRMNKALELSNELEVSHG